MLRFSGLRAAFIALLVLVAAGCELTPKRNTFGEISFQHLDPIRLNVREVVIEQAYKSPLEPPNVDHDFPIKPVDASARWAQDRLVAAGAARTATFVISDASVIEVPLEQSGGLTGVLTDEQSERYDAHIEVQLVIRDDRGWEEAKLVAEVTRTMTLAEDLTLNEREAAWYGMTEKLMADMDARLAKGIDDSFQQYLVR